LLSDSSRAAKVHGVADHGVLLAPGRTDIAGNHFAEMNADADAQRHDVAWLKLSLAASISRAARRHGALNLPIQRARRTAPESVTQKLFTMRMAVEDIDQHGERAVETIHHLLRRTRARAGVKLRKSTNMTAHGDVLWVPAPSAINRSTPAARLLAEQIVMRSRAVAAMMLPRTARSWTATAPASMRRSYHPAGRTDSEPERLLSRRRHQIILIAMLAGAVAVQLRRQFEPASWLRPRVTASPICSASTSRRRCGAIDRRGPQPTATFRHVAVMFVDFRSFTAGARSRSPQEVVDRLDGAFAVWSISSTPWRI